MSLKTACIGLHCIAETLGISSTTFTQCAAKSTEFGEITQNKGHYAVNDHSRSPIFCTPIFVLVESPYTASY